jgi:outer membrane biosynthesis protein TonB
VKLVKSSGSQRLDDATVKGLPRTRLDPAIGTDGKPIAMCNPPYQFTLVWDLQEAKR